VPARKFGDFFMMADNKEQRVCVKFFFLLGKSAAETVLMLQEAFSKTRVYEWYSRFTVK